MRSEKFEFPGAQGQNLAGRLDLPDGPPNAYAVFAHCFTCGKDLRAVRRIAAGLAARGIATLRFDFTGLGSSDGEFANTGFSSNVEDLLAAASHLRALGRAPALMIGHSLGGAAVLAAAAAVPELRAVAVIAAPFDVSHASKLFAASIPEIDRKGEAEVMLAGRRFTIRKSFLDDLRTQDQGARIAGLRKPLIVFHSPTDDIVGIDNARAILEAARHPKSFISLDGADHLLSRPADAEFTASMLATWAARYVPLAAPEAEAVDLGSVVVEATGEGRFQQRLTMGPHSFLADEPVAAGGLGSGPGPYDLLLAGLGACTSMTIHMYADRKGWKLGPVRVDLRHHKIHATDCADCETREGMLDEVEREITLPGDLDAAQRERLMEIADKCPVHRTLHSEIKIRTAERR
jgi:putative redox protein